MQKNSDAFRCPSHAARRQQHIMPSGARSVGAAILLPMITSEVAGIEERAVLAAAASSHALQRCSSIRARPGGEKSRPACKVCCCCRLELQSSARPRTSRGRLLLSFPASASLTTTCVCAWRCGVQVKRSMLSSMCADWHGFCCTVLPGPAGRSVSASDGAQGPAPMKRHHSHDGTRGRAADIPRRQLLACPPLQLHL